MIPTTGFIFNNTSSTVFNNSSISLTKYNCNNSNGANVNCTFQNDVIKKSREIAREYYRTLINEHDFLISFNFGHAIPETLKLLQSEIINLELILDASYFNSSLDHSSQNQMKEVKLRKIFIPVDEYPNCNFIGKILGPQGLTAKALEATTGCKIMVRGKGSSNGKEKHEIHYKKHKWNHLTEPLHVLIKAEDTSNRIDIKLNLAENEVKKLLLSALQKYDDSRKSQHVEMNLFNRAYQETSDNDVKLSYSSTDISRNQEKYSPASNFFNTQNYGNVWNLKTIYRQYNNDI